MIKQKQIPKKTGGKNNKKSGGNKNNKNNKNKREKVLTAGRIIFLTFLSLVLVLFLLTFLFLRYYSPTIAEIENPSIAGWVDDDDLPPEYAFDAMQRTDGIYTFLLLGLHDDGFLTDTMIFITFDTVDKTVGVLNIPRDTYVNALGYAGKKINGVFKSGYNASINAGKNKDEAKEDGVKAVVRMIKVTFGLPVNKYILADLDGFRALVDAVGGVDMDVPVRMKYTDPYQDLYIDLQPGFQHLDGGKAEQLIRFRSYPMADIERIRTQQKFMAALTKKMMKFDVGQIKKLFDINSKYVKTNITTIETGWFAAKMLDVKFEHIRMHTIPGEEYWVGADSCLSTYKAEVMEIINKYYNPYTEEIPANNFNIFEPSRTYAYLANIDGITMDSLVK